ncbi:MAG TPA: hypothetical protein VFQ53_14230 [Kofleriaceae bacterium]|nr:hypothetical protein [Kofleriaceae bacterium]
MRALALALLLVASVARADPEGDADRAFRDASQRAAAGEAGAVDAFEAIGGARPLTRWSDDAWVEAARLAERGGDFARARRDLEQALAIGRDPALVRRAKAARDRLAAITGAGRWDAVAREHERLVAELQSHGDPRPALDALAALVARESGYPRATIARLAIARGWEVEGEPARALDVLRIAVRSAPDADRGVAGLALARTAIRYGELAEARATLDALAARPGADLPAIGDVRALLAKAERRAHARIAMWLVLAVIALAAGVVLRRDAGSWRAVARRLARPPGEVVFLLPVGLVLVAVAQTGNPLIATALVAIVVSGIAVSWLSGALLDARRARAGRLSTRRTIAHAVLAIVTVGCATYLAVDRDRMIDLVVETWKHGPVAR